MISFETDEPLNFDSEDGGQAKIADAVGIQYDDSDDNGLFVRIQSWDEREDRPHPLVKELQGKRVRVTIEIL